MNFFRELSKKPWVTPEGGTIGEHDGGRFYLPTAKVGLRLFLVVVSMLFSLITVAYLDHVRLADWRPMPEPWLLWVNTLVLVLGSAAMHWASSRARQDDMAGLTWGMIGGGGLALVFLAGQLLAWQMLVDRGFFMASNSANAFYYLLTTLHGLHLLGGVLALARVGFYLMRTGEIAPLRLSVELCAAYWHYLLLVWVILFALLLFT